MLEIAARDSELSEIWEQELNDSELNPDQPSYWADTWAIVRQMDLPGTNYFLIGADQAISMHRWYRYSEFWKDALVVLRDDSNSINSLLAQMESLNAWTHDELAHWRSQIVIAPTIDASSTHIRAALNDSTRRENSINGLDPLVQEYILEHGLYTRTP